MSNKKCKIILAEDETSIREILFELLVDEGFECVPAFDGIDASHKFKEQTFDLLISDLRMPRMNGAELLRWCRKNKINIPVIFITANMELYQDEKFALSDSQAILLNKPIDFNHLVLAINSTMNSRTLAE